MSVEVSGVSGGWVTGKGTQTGKNQRAFNVPALEGKNRDPTGGTNAYTTVRPLWDAHSSGTDVETQEDRHMRQGYIYVLTTERRGYVREVGENVVQLVREGGGRSGGGGDTVQISGASPGSNV